MFLQSVESFSIVNENKWIEKFNLNLFYKGIKDFQTSTIIPTLLKISNSSSKGKYK